jgi:hypothetical protein
VCSFTLSVAQTGWETGAAAEARVEAAGRLTRALGLGPQRLSGVLLLVAHATFPSTDARVSGRANTRLHARWVCRGRALGHHTAMEKLRIVILAKVWHGATENGP